MQQYVRVERDRLESAERRADTFMKAMIEANERATRLQVALDAMTEAKDGLLRQRDQYMDRFGLLLPWLTEHVKKHDSDLVDENHVEEWDYCDWCYQHGLPDEWPCVFARAANPTLTELSARETADEE